MLSLDVHLREGAQPLFYFDSALNPYGERNFEEDTDLDYFTKHEWARQSRISIRTSKHADKTDLQKLIKAAKEKAEKDKAEQ